MGGVLGLAGILGLFLAARAGYGSALHDIGLIVFGLCVALILLMVKWHYDAVDAERQTRRNAAPAEPEPGSWSKSATSADKAP